MYRRRSTVSAAILIAALGTLPILAPPAVAAPSSPGRTTVSAVTSVKLASVDSPDYRLGLQERPSRGRTGRPPIL
jgi:hypothetical protein